jgi:hypothetical protein
MIGKCCKQGGDTTGSMQGTEFLLPVNKCGVAQWLRHYATSRKVAASVLNKVNKYFQFGVHSDSWVETLLGRKSNGFGLESREYGHRDPSRWPSGSLYQQKLALTSPTIECRSVGIVRSRTQATEFIFCLLKVPNVVRVFPVSWGRKQIQFPKRCFLVFKIPDDGQSPETQ